MKISEVKREFQLRQWRGMGQGRKAAQTVLTGYTNILDKLLIQGITNAQICLERLQEAGYPGGLTTVKDYIAAHRFLVPARRQLVAPQGSRGRRFTTEPGEAFQMDWGFTNVVFWNITDLNRAALDWCNRQNGIYHRATDGVPQDIHYENCTKQMRKLEMTPSLLFYLCPERRISFDGFVNYEGRRFGVPYSYRGSTARIIRKDDRIYIYSADLKQHLTTHDVTWSKRDRFCADQYALPEQPEEFPSMPVRTEIVQLPEPEPALSFEKFNFDKEVEWDD